MTERPNERIALDGDNADVWTWRREISGACPGCCASAVTLRVNDEEIEAPLKEERFSAVVTLQEGRNRVVALCPTGGGSAAITLYQRLKDRPTARIALSVDSDGVALDGTASAPGEGCGSPIVRYAWRARPGNPARLSYPRGATGSAGPFRIGAPPVDGEYYLSLTVTDARGRSDTATTYFVVERGRPRAPRLEVENSAWVDGAVIYGVVPHNFGRDGFRSVIARLDDLRNLGIDAIGLCPCTDTHPLSHGYSVLDYFAIRRDYGTKRDFRDLVRAAHARGIRVLMDFVPNHSSIDHRYMKHALKHGSASPYYNFYDRDQATGDYTFYFNWRHLPNLNYENPEVRRWMMEAFSYWVREFDVDGFRVDACWGVQRRRPDFWPEWRRELKRIKPDLLLLAEAGARDPYWFTEGYDAAYDWTDDLGKWSMEFVFDDPDQIVSRLHAALTNEGRGFHEDALVFRFLNNNDTGVRFITRYGPEVERAAAAMLLSLPGIPCVYTGQEAGAEFEPYNTPDPISWEDKQGLRGWYQRLIELRRRFPSLHSRRWEILAVRSSQQVYAYLRLGCAAEAPVLVVLNFSRTPAQAEIALPEPLASAAQRGALLDAITEETVPVRMGGGGAGLSLAPLGVQFLVARENG